MRRFAPLHIGVVILLALAALRPDFCQQISSRQIGLHLARNTTHFAGQYCWSLAVTVLPFATVFSLEFTMPAWVALLVLISSIRSPADPVNVHWSFSVGRLTAPDTMPPLTSRDEPGLMGAMLSSPMVYFPVCT